MAYNGSEFGFHFPEHIDLSTDTNHYNTTVRSPDNINSIMIGCTSANYSVISDAADIIDPNLLTAAHYIVDSNGKIVHLIPDHRALNVKDRSEARSFNIIEVQLAGRDLVPGKDYYNFPEAQTDSAIKLCKALQAKYNIDDINILSYSDVNYDQPLNPGPMFPFKQLIVYDDSDDFPYGNVTICKSGDKCPEVRQMQMNLAAMGYVVNVDDNKTTGIFDEQTYKALQAFRNRFAPESLEESGLDVRSYERMDDILKTYYQDVQVNELFNFKAEYAVTANYGTRPEDAEVESIVLHYTATKDLATAIKVLTNPQREASAHYLVDTDGSIVSLVREDKRAWHAGVSQWHKCTNVNNISVGIEIINLGFPGNNGTLYEDYFDYPQAQIDSVTKLCQNIKERYNIKDTNIIGHADVSCTRKFDPGPKLPWTTLAEDNVGLSVVGAKCDDPDLMICKPGDKSDIVLQLQQDLATVGYKVADNPENKPTGIFDNTTRAAVRAFRAHFSPESFDKHEWDGLSASRLDYLLHNYYEV